MSKSVYVIVGSKTDLSLVKDSGMLEVLKKCGIPSTLSVISADRNRVDLYKHCYDARGRGPAVFIAAAGMAAKLPGVIANMVGFQMPVIGVALPSEDFPNAMDALLSIIRSPGGCPVICAGIGKSGLKNAALIAAQILAIEDPAVETGLVKYIAENTKEPQIGIEI